MDMESGEEGKDEQRQPQQPPVTPPKKRKRPQPKENAQANGGSGSSSAADESSSLTTLGRTSSSSPPSVDADGKDQQQQQQRQQQQHEQAGGGGKKPRLVWTDELHDLFVEAYESLGDEAVPRRILEKMNEKMNLPEVSREKVASHLQKHKINLRKAEEASSHSPTEAPAASQPLRPLPPNTTPLATEVYQAQLELDQAQLVLVHQVLQTTPPDSLSRSNSSIATKLQIVQSMQQQLLGTPIEEGQAQPAETMLQAPADSGCSPVGMEISTAAILVPEANAEAVILMAQAGKAKNAAEPEEAAPAAGSIIGQFWTSPDNEASTSSWDIFR